jgi:hypothetical protein
MLKYKNKDLLRPLKFICNINIIERNGIPEECKIMIKLQKLPDG